MSGEIYVPGAVYGNLEKMLRLRQVVVDHRWMRPEELSAELDRREFVLIKGRLNRATILHNEPLNRRVYVVLFAEGSRYAARSPEFRKILGTIHRDAGDNLNDVDLIFVSAEALTSHIVKLLENELTRYTRLHVESIPYPLLICELPRARASFQHTIADRASIERYQKITISKPEDFPKISAVDPQIVWIGARPGEVVAINRLSENTGFTEIYKLIVEPSAIA